MDRKTRLYCRRFFVGVVSFVAMLAALIAIPYLHEFDTCLRAALVITVSYAWFAVVLWANVVLPMTKK